MASSDDEGENSVSDYYFNDEDDEPHSLSNLPMQRNESESSSANTGPIFLGGSVDHNLFEQYLAAFLENPRESNSSDEDSNDSESDGEDDYFDSVCSICDNGGVLICCEGKCFRSFHETPDSKEAQDSICESLCLTSRELEGAQPYTCENCRYSLHQCFVCAELGSSDESLNIEGNLSYVLLTNVPSVTKQKRRIWKICNLLFAGVVQSHTTGNVYLEILFEHQIGDEDDEVRGWDGLLVKSRALIYCLEHEIDPELATPARTMIFRNIM